MSADLKVSVIGLDTSHAVEFPRRMQAPDCPKEQRVPGMHVEKCLRFLTPFTDEKILAERQKQLEDWGIQVTEDFDEAVAGADAVILTVNDASYHLEYFERCAAIGVPIFLDKPMADSVESAQKIVDVADKHGTPFFTSSSLRFAPQMAQAGAEVLRPSQAAVYGPLGIAAAGSSILWYGVHSFEMLEGLLGTGAQEVTVIKDKQGVVVHVAYDDDRRGTVTLTEGVYQYGGVVRNDEVEFPFVVDSGTPYTELVEQMLGFFKGGPEPVMINHSMEIMKLLIATQKSYDSGKTEFLD
jgi:predicted dehydrogenase